MLLMRVCGNSLNGGDKMTTRLTLFDSPLFLGFDQFEKTVDRLRKSGGDG